MSELEQLQEEIEQVRNEARQTKAQIAQLELKSARIQVAYWEYITATPEQVEQALENLQGLLTQETTNA